MGGRTSKPEFAGTQGLEQKPAQTWRSSHPHWQSRQERRERDAGEAPGVLRRPRASGNDPAAGLLQMRAPSLIPLTSIALLAFSTGLLAQTRTRTPKAAHRADLTGVWYPSSVNIFGFIWNDSQGRPLKPLPLTPWGEE